MATFLDNFFCDGEYKRDPLKTVSEFFTVTRINSFDKSDV